MLLTLRTVLSYPNKPMMLLADHPAAGCCSNCGWNGAHTVKPTPSVNFLPNFCLTVKSAEPEGLCRYLLLPESWLSRVMPALGVDFVAGIVTVDDRF